MAVNKNSFLDILKMAAKKAGIPRSSVYHYNKNPGKLTREKAEKIRKSAGVTKAEWDRVVR